MTLHHPCTHHLLGADILIFKASKITNIMILQALTYLRQGMTTAYTKISSISCPKIKDSNKYYSNKVPKVQLKKGKFQFFAFNLENFTPFRICLHRRHLWRLRQYQVCALVAHKFVYLKHVAWGWGDCHKYPKYISRGNNWAQNIDSTL